MRIHLLEIKYEFLKLFRMPAYVFPTLAFPTLFYVFFGLLFGGQHIPGSSTTMAGYMLAAYGAFAVMGASLFGFGVIVAVERGQGWYEVKRTTPMPRAAYFVAKMVMAMLFSAIDVLLLMLLAVTVGHVHLPLVTALELLAVLIPGSAVFSALGLAIGYFAGPNSAAAIVNLIYLPMSIVSGLWIPIFALPRFIQRAAEFLPSYHFAQIALSVVGAGRGESNLVHVVALVASTLLFLTIAAIGWRRDEGKLYG